MLRNAKFYFILGVFLLASPFAWGDEAVPGTTPGAPSAAAAPTRSFSNPARRGDFYLSYAEPYPATFGVGLTHYLGQYLGIGLNFGKGETIVYAAGFKFRPVVARFSPIIGINVSRAVEAGTNATRGFLYFNTGVDWRFESGILIHAGVNWSATPNNADQTEMQPYAHFGFYY